MLCNLIARSLRSLPFSVPPIFFMKNMKKSILYWIPNGLLLLMMVSSGILYFIKPADVAVVFTQLGYPAYTLYFNATAKILGGIAIIFSFPRWVKEWAYAGYLYIMLMATQALFLTTPAFPWVMVVSIAIFAWAYWEFRKRAKAF